MIIHPCSLLSPRSTLTCLSTSSIPTLTSRWYAPRLLDRVERVRISFIGRSIPFRDYSEVFRCSTIFSDVSPCISTHLAFIWLRFISWTLRAHLYPFIGRHEPFHMISDKLRSTTDVAGKRYTWHIRSTGLRISLVTRGTSWRIRKVEGHNG